MDRSVDGRRRTLLFYGVLSVGLVLMSLKILKDFLPPGLAKQIGDNSEAPLLALIVCATIQWARPAAARMRQPWLLIGSIAVVCLVTTVVLLDVRGIPSTLVTLNEATFAAGIIALYVQLPHPLRWAWMRAWMRAWMLAAVLLVAVVVFNSTGFVTQQAEGLVALVLVPISFDVADPTILAPRVADRPGWRAAWCATLVALPLAFAVLSRLHLTGVSYDVVRYGSRTTEAFLGLLLVHLYFSYLQGGRWRHQPSLVHTPVAPASGVPAL